MLTLSYPAPYDGVFTDSFTGMCSATEYLISQGHKNIVMITDREQTPWNTPKINGFFQSMNNEKLNKGQKLIYNVTRNVYKTDEVIKEILSLSELPTAILCGRDWIALDAINNLVKAGLQVPNDISVMGYDNSAAKAPSFKHLTTMDVHYHECGLEMVNILTTVINRTNTQWPVQKTVIPTLIEGETIKPLSGKKKKAGRIL